MSDSFVDLRLNHKSEIGQENFWPSFTDVMTLVVMIFLMAMVILVLRNIELVKEIRTTVEAERAAMELAKAEGAQKETLASQLDQTTDKLQSAEDQLSSLQLEVMRLREQNSLRTKVINERNRELQAMTSERDQWLKQAEQAKLEKATLEQQVADSQKQLNQRASEIAELQQKQESLTAQQLLTANELASAKADLERNAQALAQASASQQQVEQRYLHLAEEYDDLKVNYDKLVRPARTASGRYLVEIRYTKKGGQFNIAMKHGGETEFSPMSQQQLESKLDKLKQIHGEGLFVRVILPEDSGLSYNEAWEFTNGLHKRYDYYFQEEKKP